MDEPRSSTGGEELLVVCLCAAWCYICNDFRAAFAGLARAHRHVGFIWVDIEEDRALVGDVDIDDFPTLAVFRGNTPVFFGVTRPQSPVVARTLASLLGAEPQPVAVPHQVAALPRSLGSRRREAPA
ncbi:MAG: thioredoxin family protein [Betaproteobacteria bacterium]|nr:thioredoxin family protein [Betaproteobacteria bacterium]